MYSQSPTIRRNYYKILENQYEANEMAKKILKQVYEKILSELSRDFSKKK